MELIFYTNPNSRGRIVRWILEEVGALYDTEVLSYGPMMKSADYLALNPMGKVPAIRHGDTVITECAAICAYLADAFPDAGLAPPPEQRGAYYRWLFFGAGPIEAALGDRMIGIDVPADKQPMVGYGSFAAVMDSLERLIADVGDGYLAGDRFSAADVYVGSQIGWGLAFGLMEPRPGFAEYWARLSAREAYQRATAIDDALAADQPAG